MECPPAPRRKHVLLTDTGPDSVDTQGLFSSADTLQVSFYLFHQRPVYDYLDR